MKKTLLLTAFVFTQLMTAQEPCVVSIPDANFKDALLSHNPVIDTNEDGEIQCDEAAAYSDILSLQFSDIEDLTGIEAFVNVPYINCSGNQLTSLDVSQNVALTRLDCNNNQLTTIDVSNNTVLQALYCGENLMTQVDVSSNTALNSFHATGSQNLTMINIANGNNSNFIRMMVAGSPNLTCIQVDAISDTANWSGADFNKPSQAQYSTNCTMSTTDFDVMRIVAYPNPTNGIVNISEMANVIVFDIQGRRIAENSNVTSFDLSSQTQGIYFAQITTGEGTETIKIVKK